MRAKHAAALVGSPLTGGQPLGAPWRSFERSTFLRDRSRAGVSTQGKTRYDGDVIIALHLAEPVVPA